MALSNEDVLQYAKDAVQKMFDEKQKDYTFPFDAVWQNTPPDVEIPSDRKPHQAARLIRLGYLEKTGGLTKAVSEKRAGSATPEYRFGSKFIPKESHAKADTSSTQSRTAGELLASMQQALDQNGYIIEPRELANFFLAMMVSPFVILSGVSGTGKSLLPRLFAKKTDSLFEPISVQPQWSDNSDLFGYVPSLSPDKFVAGKMIGPLRAAKNTSNRLVIALLDEMNLAPVEHYFSDFLSVAESRVRIDGHIATDRLPIDLPNLAAGTEDPNEDLRDIGLPHNLRVVGTANMDETTHSFSPKVLDRAFTIELDDPVLTNFTSTEQATSAIFNDHSALAGLIVDESNAISIMEAWSDSNEMFQHVADMLDDIQVILKPAGIKYGYRTRDAILLYLHHWKRLNLKDVVTANAALDFCILQKILPKISGSGAVLADALEKLLEWLNSDHSKNASNSNGEFSGPFLLSAEKVGRMAALLEVDGSTHYWGV